MEKSKSEIKNGATLKQNFKMMARSATINQNTLNRKKNFYKNQSIQILKEKNSNKKNRFLSSLFNQL
jgi:hypothetical protein